MSFPREKIQNVDIQKFFDIEDKFGFIFVRKVYQELLVYENQNTSWEEYFPKLLSSITQRKETSKIL